MARRLLCLLGVGLVSSWQQPPLTTTTSTATFARSSSRRRRTPSAARAPRHCAVRHGGFEDGVSTPVIQWYPGHIAKAEKQLVDCLKRVDVVVELRDARIPEATAHPLVEEWVGNARPRVVVFARKDMVPSGALTEWQRYLSSKKGRAAHGIHEAPIFWIDNKRGTGCRDVRKAVLSLGEYVNRRRARRGINPRAIRAAVIGFPNVGKSALINQLVGRKRAASADRPGVTRALQWIRLGNGADGCDIELLDSPGIIPARQVDQRSALKLAICNDIGEASYDGERVAAALVELLRDTHAERHSFVALSKLQERYGIDAGRGTGYSGEDYLALMAEAHHHGDTFVASRRLLADVRKGLLGKVTLDVPPKMLATDKEPRHHEGGGAGGGSRKKENGGVAAPDPSKPYMETRPEIYSSKADPATADAPDKSGFDADPYGGSPNGDRNSEKNGSGIPAIDIPDAAQMGASMFEGW